MADRREITWLLKFRSDVSRAFGQVRNAIRGAGKDAKTAGTEVKSFEKKLNQLERALGPIASQVRGGTTALRGMRAALGLLGKGGVVGGVVVGLALLAKGIFSVATELSAAEQTIKDTEGSFLRLDRAIGDFADLTGETAADELPAFERAISKAQGAVNTLLDDVDSLDDKIRTLQTSGFKISNLNPFKDEDLTLLQESRAILFGLVTGTSIAEERANALGNEMKLLADRAEEGGEKIKAAKEELEEFKAAEKAVKDVTREIERFSSKTERAEKSVQTLVRGINDSLAKEAGKLADAELGIGDAADVARGIQQALRSTGFDVEVPVKLKLEREEAVEGLKEAQQLLERAQGLQDFEGRGAAIKAAQGQVAATEAVVASIDREIAKVGEQRRQLVLTTAARVQAEQANEKALAAQKERERLEKAQAARTKTFLDQLASVERGFQREADATRLSNRERKRAVLQFRLQEAAIKANVQGADELIERVLRLRDASEQARRTDFSGALRAAAQNFADEATDAAKVMESTFNTVIGNTEDALTQFFTRGEVNLREFALGISDTIARSGIRFLLGSAAGALSQGGEGGGILSSVGQVLGAGTAAVGGGEGGGQEDVVNAVQAGAEATQSGLGLVNATTQAGNIVAQSVGAIGQATETSGNAAIIAALTTGFASVVTAISAAATSEAISGIGSAGTAGLARHGGRAERLPQASVPSFLFKNPRRFQFGGRVDTIPALLSPGERVLNPAQNRAFETGMAMGGGRPTNVNVNISTPDVAGFNRSKGQVGASLQREIQRAGDRNN